MTGICSRTCQTCSCSKASKVEQMFEVSGELLAALICQGCGDGSNINVGQP